MASLDSKQAIDVALQRYHAGNLSEAEKICREVVRHDPRDIGALHILAIVLAAQGQLPEAIDFYQKALALRPDIAEIHNNFGVALAAIKEHARAIDQYHEALRLNPRYVDSLVNLGSSLTECKRFDEAITAYRRAIELKPGFHTTFNNLGVALVAIKQYDEAIAAYHSAIRLKDDYADAHNNLGVAYWELKRLDEAFAEYQATVRHNPNHAAGHSNLGNYFIASGRASDAIAAFQTALRLTPDFDEAWCNLGIALMENGQYDQAMAVYEKARKLAPDAVEPHWGMACLTLLLGDFQTGWTEYEWRWQAKSRSASVDNIPRPTWNGQPLNGRRILLRAEQGLGDSILFIRYAPLVAQRGGRVIIKCTSEVQRLFAGVAGIEQIVVGDEMPVCDEYCPLMSLPLMFATRLETIPANVPYIQQNPALLEIWKAKVGDNSSKLKVGICWAGGPAYQNDRKRSVALSQFEPLWRVADTAYYSLQKGHAADQVAQLPAGKEIIDLTADLNDLADTAALISQLDLVISVDTAVAHLAGALGRPVWLLIPTNPDWRWMLDRDDSPWYPTMRLFRQKAPGDWTNVIERVKTALNGLRAGVNDTAVPRQMTTADAIKQAWQHHQSGQFSEAAAIYRQIIAQQPQNADVLHLMGLVALDAKQFEAAAGWISRAVTVNPAIPEYQNNLARALSAGGQFAPAIEVYRNVIRLRPDFPDVSYNLGNALLKSKRYDEAIKAYQEALEHRPEHADLHMNLGQALVHTSQHKLAVSSFNEALRLNPASGSAQMNLGLAFMQMKQMDAAMVAAKKAVALDPDSVDSHWLLAALALLTGDFTAGWKEHEWRLKGDNPSAPRIQFSQPRWDGKALAGKTILLYAEQGLGDTIQFIRYAPMVADLGGKVIVLCPPALVRLAKSMPGISQVVTSADDLSFEVQCPMMSLPLAFQTTLNSIPASVLYLHADENDIRKWASRIASENEKRVGLVWAGRPAYKDDAKRSIALTQLTSLAHVPNITFYSLQKGPAAAQSSNPPAGLKWIDLTSDLNDFADTAAFISQLDLVISVDTAVAHLAGAMGKPVLLLIPYDPDWRWMLDRTDSPWYPTMKLFRQRSRGDWDEVIERIASELKKHDR